MELSKSITPNWNKACLQPQTLDYLSTATGDDLKHDLPFDGEGYILAGRTLLSTKSLLGNNAVQRVSQSDTEWYRTVTYRDDWTVPTERGFCIEGALIGESSYKSEEAEQFINLLSGHYSLLNIHTRESVNADKNASLLKDLPALRQKLRDSGYGHNISVLREGNLQVAGMDAEEVLFFVRDSQIQLFRFYLRAPGTADPSPIRTRPSSSCWAIHRPTRIGIRCQK